MAEQTDIKREERRRMMLEEPVFKVIPKIAFPMVISMLIDSFYNLADTFFVSQIGTAATAAVGINTSLMVFIRAISMCFGLGAASYISRLLGAKKADEASRVASTSVITGIAVITAAAAVAYVFRSGLVSLLGATATSKPYSIDYASYILFAAPFTAGEICLSQSLRSEGSTTYSMIGMVSGCVVNLALDPLFIFVFDWGVAGAAAATAISKVISFVVLLAPFLMKKSLLTVSFKLFTPTWKNYSEILKIGLPAFLRMSLLSVSSVITNSIAGAYSDSVLAAVSVSNRIMMFIGSMVIGFSQGFQPVAGYCWGAGNYKRIKSSFWATSLIGVAICVFFGSLLFIFAPQVVGLFTKTDTEIIKTGSYMVKIQSVVLPLHMWTMVINGLFQALGRPISATILSLSRQAICLIPCVIIMSRLFGVQGLTSAQAVADVLTMLIALPLLMRILRELSALVAGADAQSSQLQSGPEADHE